MGIRIPNRPESDPARALDEAIRRAAQVMHISPGMAAMIASHLFEQIALQLCRGRMVRVTGFGMFGTRRFHPKNDSNGFAIPTFAPSRGLRQEIKPSVMKDQTNGDEMRRYRKRNRAGTIPLRSAQRTWTAQQGERRRIMNENFGSVEID